MFICQHDKSLSVIQSHWIFMHVLYLSASQTIIWLGFCSLKMLFVLSRLYFLWWWWLFFQLSFCCSSCVSVLFKLWLCFVSNKEKRANSYALMQVKLETLVSFQIRLLWPTQQFKISQALSRILVFFLICSILSLFSNVCASCYPFHLTSVNPTQNGSGGLWVE